MQFTDLHQVVGVTGFEPAMILGPKPSAFDRWATPLFFGNIFFNLATLCQTQWLDSNQRP